jgi:hypothetical protein
LPVTGNMPGISADDQLAVADDGRLPRRADGEDRGLGRVIPR